MADKAYMVNVWDPEQQKYVGIPAITGRGIQSMTDNGDGTMQIVYTDGTKETVQNEAFNALEDRVNQALGVYINEVAELVGGDV